MTPRRVLVVAYYFPPIVSAGSIRLAGLSRHLPEHGWEPTVLASARTPHPTDLAARFADEHTIRARSLELSQAGRVLPVVGGGRNEPTASRGLRGLLRRAAHRYLYYPDAQVGWYPMATLGGLRALRSGDFDAIYSSSFPITAHLIARTLHRATGIRWVAEFRDPWSAVLPPSHPHRARGEELERSLAAEASAVVMPTRTWAGYFAERWGRAIDVVPNGFDEGDARCDASAPPEPVVVHVGSYYAGRQDYNGLWRALALLRSEGTRRPVRLRWIGDMPTAARLEVEAADVADLVDVTGHVEHQRVGEMLATAGVLVACGFDTPDLIDRGVIPAKLFEYLPSGRPIVYLDRFHGEGAALLDGQPNCYVVDPHDDATIASVVRAGIETRTEPRVVDAYSRAETARALAAVLERAAASP